MLDKELMSGIGLTKYDATKYKDILYSGVELDVLTESETPTKRAIDKNEKEEFIHLLTGSLTIHPQNGKPQTYFKGDFFVLPKGFSGTWKSNGLLRILKVIQK
ncbi:MAG: cupin domain-containing protein [Bacteroidota bacterium]